MNSETMNNIASYKNEMIGRLIVVGINYEDMVVTMIFERRELQP